MMCTVTSGVSMNRGSGSCPRPLPMLPLPMIANMLSELVIVIHFL